MEELKTPSYTINRSTNTQMKVGFNPSVPTALFPSFDKFSPIGVVSCVGCGSSAQLLEAY
eukprot:6106232-Amphidinium_carterae.1